jgi:hypothetical protein
MRKVRLVSISIVFGIFLCVQFARADGVDAVVTFNTSALTSLPGSSGGPFELALVFTDGSGTGDGNNTITLSDFNLGGGAVTPTPDDCFPPNEMSNSDLSGATRSVC